MAEHKGQGEPIQYFGLLLLRESNELNRFRAIEDSLSTILCCLSLYLDREFPATRSHSAQRSIACLASLITRCLNFYSALKDLHNMSNARSDSRSSDFVTARSRASTARSGIRSSAFVSARSNPRSDGARSASRRSGASASRESAVRIAVDQQIRKELQTRYVCHDQNK